VDRQSGFRIYDATIMAKMDMMFIIQKAGSTISAGMVSQYPSIKLIEEYAYIKIGQPLGIR